MCVCVGFPVSMSTGSGCSWLEQSFQALSLSQRTEASAQLPLADFAAAALLLRMRRLGALGEAGLCKSLRDCSSETALK